MAEDIEALNRFLYIAAFVLIFIVVRMPCCISDIISLPLFIKDTGHGA
jgi:hypothetical protein